MEERERGRWPRGPLIYYLLAAFDILTVSASLFLNHRIMSIYVGSVEANQEWAERMTDYAALSRLAAEVDAPGNDVFNSRDVPAESARMQANLVTFDSPVLILDREGRTLRLNRAGCEIAELQDEDVVGKQAGDLGEGEPWRSIGRVAQLTLEGRAPTSAQARDELTARTWEVSGNVVPDDRGPEAEGVIVVARDVTRLVELQESVRREERMSAMGSLLAGVAHEVRNPLFGISSTLDAFEARHGHAEPFRQYLTVLKGEVARLSTLMRDLLDYGKPRGLEVREADLGEVVDEAARLCESLANNGGVRIIRAHDWALERVPMDRSRMLQVLQNVIENAIQHSPKGGMVVLSGGAERVNGGAWTWCSVRDSGPGFQAADLTRVFEPFFTRRKGGTGLGLSIAQRIVSQHGGLIHATNHPEGGGLVTVKLPAAGPLPRPA